MTDSFIQLSQVEEQQQLLELLTEKRVVVCYGAGGVGKTTTSAALGVKAALAGRRVLVLTIDPAKRLADTLHISIEGGDPHPIDEGRFVSLGETLSGGSLSIWMVQPSMVFDKAIQSIVSAEKAAEVFDLTIYQSMRKMVSGMQEYMAGESLYQFVSGGAYDLVILDTPPSRNAVDFLMAPEQLLGFLDSRILRAFVPDSSRFSLFSQARRVLRSVFQNVGGSGFLGQIQTFTSLILDGLEVLKEHAEEVQRLLRSDESGHLLVSSPEPASIEEIRYFQKVLSRLGLPLKGLILNRSLAAHPGQRLSEYAEAHPDWDVWSASLANSAALLAPLEAKELAIAEGHRKLLAQLKGEANDGSLVLAAPHLGRDIDDLEGLLRLARQL